MEELIDTIKNQKLDAIKRKHIYSTVTNIILIIVIFLIGIYIYINIESFKSLGQDVCRLCEEKTGGSCIAQSYSEILNMTKQQAKPVSVFDNINLSDYT